MIIRPLNMKSHELFLFYILKKESGTWFSSLATLLNMVAYERISTVSVDHRKQGLIELYLQTTV